MKAIKKLIRPFFFVLSVLILATSTICLSTAHALPSVIMIDLDNTLGYQLESEGKWILYDGAIENLIKPLFEDGHTLVFCTVNLKENVDRLFDQYPELKKYVKRSITAEDMSLQFSQLMRDMKQFVTKNISKAQWQDLLFDVWKSNPAKYSPPGTPLKNYPTSLMDWRMKIYFPYLRPDKTRFVREENAILYDDIFSFETVPFDYLRLKLYDRGFFIGKAGGESPDAGPDYKLAVEWIRKKICHGYVNPSIH